MGSIPGQGTEIPHAAGGGQINQKQTEQQNTVVNQRSLSRKGKRCITEWETMSANHRSEKGLVCRTGKNCYNRTEDNPTGKWARGSADTPPKTVHRRPKEHVKRCSTPVSHPVQFSSVQSCPTLCDPMNRSTPGLPVHHQLPEFTQTHVYQVSDAIQPSHPLSSPSPLAPNPSQHQSLFQ